jgi:alkanesulfonate monooxygenase SsuD/methylene tetrahydromethanopterin reductase-like flavin-dependent oxidoreductase (luciferase family)
VARFEEALVELRRAWSGEPLVEGFNPIGPRPGPEGPPELTVGGFAPAAVHRAARYADGLNVHDIAGNVEAARASFELMVEAWKEYGRPGRPRLIAGFFYSLGPRAGPQLKGYFDDYYAYGGPDIEAMIADVTTYSIEAISDKLAQFKAIGCDLVILTPVTWARDQLEGAAEVVA